MRQIKQLLIGPNRLRHVHDHVVGFLPRREDADLGLALRANGPFQEADPRMPSAGIGQHLQRGAGLSLGTRFRADVESLQGGLDLRGGKPRSGGNLFVCEAMIPDHVPEPVSQWFLVGRFSEVRRFSFLRGDGREEDDNRGEEDAARDA